MFSLWQIFNADNETPKQFVSLVKQLRSSQEQQIGSLPSKSFLQGSSLPSAVPIYCTAPATCARGSTSRWVCVSHGSYVTLTRAVIGAALSVWGGMRQQLIAQANKQNVGLWVCGDGGAGMEGRWSFSPCGMKLHLPQHSVSRGDGKRSPWSPPPRATSDV